MVATRRKLKENESVVSQKRKTRSSSAAASVDKGVVDDGLVKKSETEAQVDQQRTRRKRTKMIAPIVEVKQEPVSDDEAPAEPLAIVPETTHDERHDEPTPNFETQIDLLIKSKEEDRRRIKNDIQALKAIKKNIQRLLRNKKKRKKSSTDDAAEKTGGGARPASGFARLSPVTDELCQFLDVPSGTRVSRTDVTREIHKYIKKHCSYEGIIVHADTTLENLLGGPHERYHTIAAHLEKKRALGEKTSLELTDELTFWNLQTHFNKHFIKTTTPTTTTIPTTKSQPVAIEHTATVSV